MGEAGVEREGVPIQITYCGECGLRPLAEGLAKAIAGRFGVTADLVEGHGGIYQVTVGGGIVATNRTPSGRFPTDEEILAAIGRRLASLAGARPERVGLGSRKLAAMNPMGYPPRIEPLRMAPRSGTLEGKTVYLVDVRFDDGDLLLKQMQAWFAEHMPTVKTVLASKSGVHVEDDPKLFQEIRENTGAVVMAIGH